MKVRHTLHMDFCMVCATPCKSGLKLEMAQKQDKTTDREYLVGFLTAVNSKHMCLLLSCVSNL